MNVKRNWKETVSDLVLVVAGNLAIAIAATYFTIPFHLLTGGTAGIAVILEKLFAVPEQLTIYLLPIGLYVVGTATLGWGFAMKTALSTFIYPPLVTLLSLKPIALNIDPMLASLYAGVFLGLGTGLVFRTGGSTGGMDVPPLLLNKYFGISLSTGALIVDALTVLFGIVAYDLSAALIGLISVYVSSLVIDKVLMFGGEQSKVVYIISEKWSEISQAIQDETQRGVTHLAGRGGYRGDNRPVVFCVIKQSQYPEINRIINRIDPTAFCFVSEATEVRGNGFTYKEDEKTHSSSERS